MSSRKDRAAFRPDTPEPQLVHLATDGESYGHHHRFGEMALAFALHEIELRIAEALERPPPAVFDD